jgi:hypothetical protein
MEFERFMKEHIASRKSEAKKMLALGDGADGDNLFGRLVHANETEGRLTLDDQELLGNYFIFLFAGHGSSLCINPNLDVSSFLCGLVFHRRNYRVHTSSDARAFGNSRR